MISCVAEPDQYAALAAIVGDHSAVRDAREHYRANLEVATEALDAAGIRYLDPRGAFYLWIDVSHASRRATSPSGRSSASCSASGSPSRRAAPSDAPARGGSACASRPPRTTCGAASARLPAPAHATV